MQSLPRATHVEVVLLSHLILSVSYIQIVSNVLLAHPPGLLVFGKREDSRDNLTLASSAGYLQFATNI